jgi:hypothetical protein
VPMDSGEGWRYTSPDGKMEIRIGDKGVDGNPYARVLNLTNKNYLTTEGKGPASGDRETDRLLTHFTLVP